MGARHEPAPPRRPEPAHDLERARRILEEALQAAEAEADHPSAEAEGPAAATAGPAPGGGRAGASAAGGGGEPTTPGAPSGHQAATAPAPADPVLDLRDPAGDRTASGDEGGRVVGAARARDLAAPPPPPHGAGTGTPTGATAPSPRAPSPSAPSPTPPPPPLPPPPPPGAVPSANGNGATAPVGLPPESDAPAGLAQEPWSATAPGASTDDDAGPPTLPDRRELLLAAADRLAERAISQVAIEQSTWVLDAAIDEADRILDDAEERAARIERDTHQALRDVLAALRMVTDANARLGEGLDALEQQAVRRSPRASSDRSVGPGEPGESDRP